MIIMSPFKLNGDPAIGLNPLPTIRIRDVITGDLVITDVSMTEVGDGVYSYDFSSRDISKDYSFRCDGGESLSTNDRYTFGATGLYDETIDSVNTTLSGIDIRTELIRKIQTNRLELSDGSSSNWILYDSDDITPLLTFSITDKDGNAIVQSSNVPSKRSRGV